MKIPLALLLTLIFPAQANPPITESPPPIEEQLRKVPHHLLNRCTESRRLAAIQKHNGNPDSEKAVLHALRFLKNTQNKDGSWTTSYKVPMTALALLTFLGHGETAQSDEFGVHVLNGIQFLIDVAVEHKGKMSSDFRNDHWPYEHALATHALAEAYALCERGFDEKIPNLKRAVEVAGQFLINAQHQGGGWDYQYSEDSARGGDVSITTWHLLALKSCHLTRLEFKNLTKAYKKGLDYIENRQMSSGAIGYSNPALHGTQDGTTLAALGGYCFQIWKHPATKVARKAVRFIDKEMRFDWNTPDSDLYGHFFAAQAMFNNQGPEWQRYHQLVFPQILQNQAPDGSFLPVNKGDRSTIHAVNAIFAGPESGPTHYRTCLATLILQTYYRNPHPIRQP